MYDKRSSYLAEWLPIDVPAGCTAKDPGNRFPSYSALLEALWRARPLNLPDARWLVRGMAWLIDLNLLLAITAILLIPTQVGPLADFVSGNSLLTCCVRIPTLLAPALAALFQARWATTPAKKLLQICIVDQHGLRPGAGTLACRSVFQFAAVWVVCLKEMLAAVGFTSTVLGILVAIAFLGLHAISAVQAIFSKHGRTIHDRIFHTRVCLDVGSTNVR